VEGEAARMDGAPGGLRVRASIGTLAVLGLAKVKMDARPTTAYLLQYSPYGCLGGCSFCSQSLRYSGRVWMLSRVTWPAVSLEVLVERLAERQGAFARVCLQTVLKPFFHEEATLILEALHEGAGGVPVSVASTPVPRWRLEQWRRLGVDHLGVGLDAATPELFKHVGKPYSWRRYMEFIWDGVSVFGRGRVYVHLIAGLGEKPVELVEAMEKLYRMGARVALFRYTPLPGLPRHPGVSVEAYRLLQIARGLLEAGISPWDYLDPQSDGSLILARCPPLNPYTVFTTSGCPGCNRPFYNESPRGPIYNYPNSLMLRRDLPLVRRQLERVAAPEARGCLGRWLS
jgi:biotin synthase-related radical SAM superfamily protein